MSFGLIVSPKAEESYEATVSQVRQRWGSNFVSKFEIKVEKSIKAIVLNPFIYPITDNRTEIRKCVLHKNCSMLYRIYDTTVVIICFWDNRQDPIILP